MITERIHPLKFVGMSSIQDWNSVGDRGALDFHQDVERLYFKIERAREAGQTNVAQGIAQEAAGLEEQALGTVTSDHQETRAILGTNAVTLYSWAGDHTNVKRLGQGMLREIDQSDQTYRSQIEEMVAQAEKLAA